jgi:hypothetical protein
VSALIRHSRFIDGIIKTAEMKSITGHRPETHETQKDEEILFEKEFDKITDDDRVKLKELNDVIKKRAEEKKKE